MKYLSEKPVPFHMPGHKLGQGFPEDLSINLLSLDITEIPGSDDLHCPTGIIQEAEQLAAKTFCSDRTYFLVNGSTCGIHSIIMALCRPGDKLIVARDCHKSIVNGMMLAGVIPVYIQNVIDKDFLIPKPINPTQVDLALKENPEAKGVFITRPNYYGTCADIEEIARIVHSYGKVLAVDEAHGAHLVFNDKLPVCAMKGGADICVQSAHKTLPALTQGSFIHVKSARIDIERLEFFLRLLQTSSPSYIIMASLDYGRELMETEGEEMLNRLLGYIEWFENSIGQIEGIKKLYYKETSNINYDNTRITLNFEDIGISGFLAEKYLRNNHHIQVEMSDINNIVCIGTVSDSREYYEKLSFALKKLKEELGSFAPPHKRLSQPTQLPKNAMGLKEVLQAKAIDISLTKAEGRISKDLITPYPPGIPLVCPGEIISNDIIQYIGEVIKHEGNVNGVGEDLQVRVVL